MQTIGQVDIILALSLLLAAGFGAARLVRLLHLPSVTGYILAGIALGPSGLQVVPADALEAQLRVFTEIALMLVAFGIGERFDLGQLRQTGRVVARVSLAESLGAFLAVLVAVGATAWATGQSEAGQDWRVWASTALLCASIGVATAPAATVSVMRELQASGPVSRLVLSSVVVNNALSITLFGVCAAASRALLGTATGAGIVQAIEPIATTLAAIGLGLVLGLATDFLVHKLSDRSDVLIVALTAVFFCGGAATYLGLSPLLCGVAAGFAVVNRDRRDVRAFRALRDFEPPIYGLFFSLAGLNLHLGGMVEAGAVGIAFVLARGVGKYLGAGVGGLSAGLSREQSAWVGLGLIPQAGLAIGLAFLVSEDTSLAAVRDTVISVVVTSVVINELAGPPLVRLMCLRTGEAPGSGAGADPGETEDAPGLEVVPWTWPRLVPAPEPRGHVAASLSHPTTAPGVTRIATLLSHHFGATPLAVRVVTEQLDSFWEVEADLTTVSLFRIAREEAASLGYPLSTEVEFADDVAQGLLRVSDTQHAHALVLGHPLSAQPGRFARIVDAVARDAICPVVIVKFCGPLHTERILVPVSSEDEFATVEPVVSALGEVQEHQITVLMLTPPETRGSELERRRVEALGWAVRTRVPGRVTCEAVGAESRAHAILEASDAHDIVVMAAATQGGLRRVFFGSLAEDVAQKIRKPMLLVRASIEVSTRLRQTEG